MKLYENIRLKRLEYSWTQSDLAKRMGYSDKSMIAKIEAGKGDLSQTKIKAFADVFHCSPAQLMGWDDSDAQSVPTYDKTIIEIISLLDKMTPEQRQSVLNFMRSFVN